MLERSALLLLGVSIAAGSAGCAQKHLTAKNLTLDDGGKVGVIAYASTLRGAYVFPVDRDYRYCAEPPPDAALETLQEMSGAVKANVAEQGSGEAEFSSKVATEAFELAGRTQLVLLARELLYRICELSINHPQLTPAEAAHLYERVADVVENISQRDRLEAASRLYEARQAARLQIEAEDRKIDAILARVATGGRLDKDKLAALLEAAKGRGLTQASAETIGREETLDGLRTLLSEDLDSAIDPLHEAL